MKVTQNPRIIVPPQISYSLIVNSIISIHKFIYHTHFNSCHIRLSISKVILSHNVVWHFSCLHTSIRSLKKYSSKCSTSSIQILRVTSSPDIVYCLAIPPHSFSLRNYLNFVLLTQEIKVRNHWSICISEICLWLTQHWSSWTLASSILSINILNCIILKRETKNSILCKHSCNFIKWDSTMLIPSKWICLSGSCHCPVYSISSDCYQWIRIVRWTRHLIKEIYLSN